MGFSGPTVFGRLPRAPLDGTENCDGDASSGDRDGPAVLLDLVEDGEALGFELGGVYDQRLHNLLS
jgi:hypothetical protein